MVLKIERFQPEGMNVRMSGGKPSYSHVVTVSGSGKIVYTAGQLARDVDGNCVGKGICGRRWNRHSRTSTGVSRRPAPPGPMSSRPTPLSPTSTSSRSAATSACAISGWQPDQHDSRRHASRRTRFHDRDRGGRRRKFLRSGVWTAADAAVRQARSEDRGNRLSANRLRSQSLGTSLELCDRRSVRGGRKSRVCRRIGPRREQTCGRGPRLAAIGPLN
jgi:hypothetical protein